MYSWKCLIYSVILGRLNANEEAHMLLDTYVFHNKTLLSLCLWKALCMT